MSNGDLLLTLVFNEPLTAITFDSPCWKLYVGTKSGLVRQYNLKNPPRTLNQHIDNEHCKDYVGHKGKIVGMTLNFSNTILATGGEDHFVVTWDILSRQMLQKFEHNAPVTCLKFVQNFSNFHEQILKPRTIIKTLKRNMEEDIDDLVISQVQSDDIEFSDEENGVEKEASRVRLERENVTLRVINSQLFNTALEISKKFNGDLK